ncbi:unnamed protein product [Fraxinus pennsylvanica]|uniref:Uncharacterized protein n=1 Tax=Fraxinus pennsylvanica TaxID=56036 RepID=A0AAD2AEP1_9LAMI|nr:unnamed protein product [Fraxinus pennsylvanica]
MVFLSRIATNNGYGEKSSYFDGWKAYDSDPFHPTKNTLGVIQMGLAENQVQTRLLFFDLIQEWVENNPKASICKSQGSNGFKDVALAFATVAHCATLKFEFSNPITRNVTCSVKGVTDSNEHYKLNFSGDHEDTICEVNLPKSPEPECSVPMAGQETIGIVCTENS